MSLGLLILGLALFICLVVVHEFGHFIVARRNGVEVEEFGIFFPPRLWKRKTKKGWIFSINVLPLGGFVRLKGEHDADTGAHTYGGSSLSIKAKILLAGIVMNLLAAFVLLTALSWLGMPQLINNQFSIKSDTHYIEKVTTSVVIDNIEAHSPAASVGLKADDTLVAIGPINHLVYVNNGEQLSNLGKQFAGQKVAVVYKQNNKQYTQTVTLRTAHAVSLAASQNHPEGYLGVVDETDQKGISLTRATWSAPIEAAGVMVQYTGLSLHGLGLAFKGLGSTIAGLVTHNKAAREAGQTQASSQVHGPVGVYEILKNGSVLGYQFVLMIVAIISLSLAVVNILPIPVLDGGKLFLTILFRGLHRPLTEQTESVIYGISFLVLLTLMVLITIVDVKTRNF